VRTEAKGAVSEGAVSEKGMIQRSRAKGVLSGTAVRDKKHHHLKHTSKHETVWAWATVSMISFGHGQLDPS
jgi:hypothetical protein